MWFLTRFYMLMSILKIFANLPGKECLYSIFAWNRIFAIFAWSSCCICCNPGGRSGICTGGDILPGSDSLKILSIFRQGLIWCVKCLGVFFFRILLHILVLACLPCLCVKHPHSDAWSQPGNTMIRTEPYVITWVLKTRPIEKNTHHFCWCQIFGNCKRIPKM